MTDEHVSTAWKVLGYSSNVLFGASLVFQWWVSERKKKSVIPLGFWWMRIAGAAALLCYALRIWTDQGPVILGQVTGLFTYVRNVALIRREKRLSQVAPAGE
jgi:lipid-A-disaccharide synthase-like uncharacterized protein